MTLSLSLGQLCWIFAETRCLGQKSDSFFGEALHLVRLMQMQAPSVGPGPPKRSFCPLLTVSTWVPPFLKEKSGLSRLLRPSQLGSQVLRRFSVEAEDYPSCCEQLFRLGRSFVPRVLGLDAITAVRCHGWSLSSPHLYLVQFLAKSDSD